MDDALELAKDNLLRSLDDFEAADLPDPGVRWETYARSIRAQAFEFDDAIAAIRFAQDPDAHGGFEARHQTEHLKSTVSGQDGFLLESFPLFSDKLITFAETPVAREESVLLHEGRYVSSPMYSHARFIMRCLSYCKPAGVVEIGGGYGAPGRLWMTNGIHNPDIYIDIDLPESLFFAEVYQRTHFGADSVVYLHDESDLDRIDGQTRFVMCGPQSIEHLRELEFELVLNTLSFAEMSGDYVAHYIDWLGRQDASHFYSYNYIGSAIAQMEENVNFMSPVMPRDWAVRYRQRTGSPPYQFAEQIFERDDAAQNIAQAHTGLAALLEAPLTADTYVELIDACRFIDEPQVLGAVILKIHAESDTPPKELVELLAWLDAMDTQAVDEPSRRELDRIRRETDAAVAGSDSGKVSVHLDKDDPGQHGEADLNAIARAREAFRDPAMLTVTPDAGGGPGTVQAGDGTFPVSGDAFGTVENISVDGTSITAIGWAADTAEAVGAAAVFCMDGDRCIGAAVPEFEREDIAHAFGPKTRLAGFRIVVECRDASNLVFIAASRKGRFGMLIESSG